MFDYGMPLQASTTVGWTEAVSWSKRSKLSEKFLKSKTNSRYNEQAGDYPSQCGRVGFLAQYVPNTAASTVPMITNNNAVASCFGSGGGPGSGIGPLPWPKTMLTRYRFIHCPQIHRCRPAYIVYSNSPPHRTHEDRARS